MANNSKKRAQHKKRTPVSGWEGIDPLEGWGTIEPLADWGDIPEWPPLELDWPPIETSAEP